MKIQITDSKEMMEKIGEQLVQEHSAIYTEAMLATLRKTINEYKEIPLEGEELDKELYRTVYDYWVYGNSCDEEYYYRFYEKSHEEKLSYMTFRLREKYCKHLNPGDASLFVDKYKTYQFFKKYYLRDVIQICGPQDYSTFVEFVKKHPTFVVKPKDMAFGIGVYLVKEEDYTDYKSLFESVLLSGRQNKENIVWAKNDSLVLEEVIEQEETVASVHPYSVNGIRVTTVKHNGKITLLHPWFKIGANKQFVTSAVFGTMDAGINPETGIVETNGYKENGENFEYHPNTNVKINGFQIPRWNELVGIAKEVAMMLPDINYVGWDFVLTPKGWCIMEANYDGDFMWQLYYGKGMKEEFENLIEWKMESDYWWE